MLDLRKIDARYLLKEFETPTFQYNTKEDFYLNEEEEKIWSYINDTEGNESVIILQIMLFKGELLISYSSEIYDELVRARVSTMALILKSELLAMYPKYVVKLEQPLIENFELYQENLFKVKAVEQGRTIEALFSAYSIEKENIEVSEHQFYINGDDGKFFAEMLNGTFPFVSFEDQEDGNHLFTLKLHADDFENELINAFLRTVTGMGYSISYLEPIQDYSREDFIGLMNSGLIEIKQ